MKNIAMFLAAFAGLAFLSSCSKQIYSHQQVMLSYRTKDDVLRQFGEPDEIIAINDTTKWLYNCSDPSVFNDTQTKVKINGVYNVASGFHTIPVSVKQFSQYDKYVIFILDKDGKVLNWGSSGVNFAQRKTKVLATVAVVAGVVLGVVVIVGAIDLLSHPWKPWSTTPVNVDFEF
jgi:hypothetical protein